MGICVWKNNLEFRTRRADIVCNSLGRVPLVMVGRIEWSVPGEPESIWEKVCKFRCIKIGSVIKVGFNKWWNNICEIWINIFISFLPIWVHRQFFCFYCLGLRIQKKKRKSFPCIYVSKDQGLGEKRTQAIENSWRKPHLCEQGLCHTFNLKNNSNENPSSEIQKVREEDLNGV